MTAGRIRAATAGAASVLLATGGAAIHAQDYPVRPVKMIVPAAPGGGNDAIARLVAQHLSNALGQQVVVENRGGAGGNVGTEAAAKAPPDGYTLLLAFSGPLAMTPGLVKTPYDPLASFAHIGLLARGYQILVVHPAVPAQTLPELIALARAKPGTLNYASAGNGTPLHLAAELFRLAAGIEMVHIPYKGSSPAATAVLAGDAQLLFGGLVSSLPHVRAGRLRALAVTSPLRAPQAPDTPTLSESGYPGVDPVSWYGLSAPAGTPAPVIDRLSRETVRLVAAQEYRDLLLAQAQEPVSSTPDDFRAFIAADLAKWKRVIREAKIRAD